MSFLSHSSPYYCSLAPAPASASATSAGSASEPELRFCSAVQHYDDFPAWAAKRAADQHQSAAEQHTTRHHCGHFHTGPTNPVGTQPRLVHQEVPLPKISRLISFEWSLVSFYFFLILVFLMLFSPGSQRVSSWLPNSSRLRWHVEQSWFPPPCSWDRLSLPIILLVVSRLVQTEMSDRIT